MARYKDTDIRHHIHMYQEYWEKVSMKLKDFAEAYGFSPAYARKVKVQANRLLNGFDKEEYIFWEDYQSFALVGVSKRQLASFKNIVSLYGLTLQDHSVVAVNNFEKRMKLSKEKQVLLLTTTGKNQREWAYDIHHLLQSKLVRPHIIFEGARGQYEQWLQETHTPEEISNLNERVAKTLYSADLKNDVLHDLRTYSAHFVAKKYAGVVAHTTIRKWAKENNIPLLTLKTGAAVPEGMNVYGTGQKKKVNTWIENRNEDILAALGEMTVPEVAEKFKLTPSYVYKLMSEGGKSIKEGNSKRLTDKKSKALDYYQENSWKDTCEKFGISRSTLFKWVKEEGTVHYEAVSEERRMEIIQQSIKSSLTVTEFAKEKEISINLARKLVGLAEEAKARDFFSLASRDDCLILGLPWEAVKYFNKKIEPTGMFATVEKDMVHIAKGDKGHFIPLDNLKKILYRGEDVIDMSVVKLRQKFEKEK